MSETKPFPDVAHFGAPPAAIGLARVGMSDIEIPIRVADSEAGSHLVMGKADAYVSLDDAQAKGIHMSRIFLKLNEWIVSKAISSQNIEHCLRDFVESHKGLSQNAFLKIKFELPLLRPALKSNNTGWRSYPISIDAKIEQGMFSLQLGLQITYSSTCPCSAALARQLIQEKFKQDFSELKSPSLEEVADWLGREDSILATPHGQRSHANVSLVMDGHSNFSDIPLLINQVEAALGTPVQAAVKREDEQEFARLNGANLMFAEDAARKASTALDKLPNVKDFKVEVIHYESLHPHNAVAVAVKGVDQGLR